MKKTTALILSTLMLAAILTGCGSSRETQQTMEDDLISAQESQQVQAKLPAEFSASAHDDEYFQPDSEDFIVISYEMPLVCWEPCWYKNSSGVMQYGPYRDEMVSESVAKVTYVESFDGDDHLSTKVRIEYGSAEAAMLAGLVHGFNIVPTELGYPNEQDDALVTEDYFEAADQMLFGGLSATDYDATYQGHFDNFRYFELRPRDTAEGLKLLADIPLSDRSEAMVRVPFSSLSYVAGETVIIDITNYSKKYEVTTYSSKKTHEAGSDTSVLDALYKLSGDGDYFSPLTDDYVYVIKVDSVYDYGNGIKDYMQEAYLYSYDGNGNIVQCIKRMYNSYFLQEGFDYKSYFPDYTEEDWNRVVYDEAEKVFYIDDFTKYGQELVFIYDGLTAKQSLEKELTEQGQHEGYYFSKP